MTTHQKAVQKAVKALPAEDPSEISAVINPDGTVDTYTSLSAPDWLSYRSRILRNKVAKVISK